MSSQIKPYHTIVFTGGPGFGKTALVLALEEQGYPIVHEAAESRIRLLKARGVAEPWNLPDFQDGILNLQEQRIREARKIAEGRPIVCDRYYLDSPAYFEHRNQQSTHCMDEKFGVVRAEQPGVKVFLVGPMNHYVTDEVRHEQLQEANVLAELHEKWYRKMGFSPVPVPSGTVDERVQFVLTELRKPFC